MKYKILDENKKTVKTIQSDSNEEEILRNYPLNYTLEEIK